MYLNEGYEWVVDLDIEKYFDAVNHDKLISILREKVNDSQTLSLIRAFLKNREIEGWKPKPNDDRAKKLYEKIKRVLSRRHAVARTLGETFTKVNQIVIGWINYFRIGKMRVKMKIFGEWLRHKIRCIILKQWKNIKTIYRNLTKINKTFKLGFDEESIYKVANSRRGWYAKSNGDVINFMISPKLLATPNKKKGRPGLVLPFEYYLNSLC